MHRLGLLPLVKKFHVCKRSLYRIDIFSPKRLDYSTLRYFLALTNVQELGIDHLDIPSFMPKIQKYFGHFLPTVRSLSLRAPNGSARQIVYFIGLFERLQDLKLLHDDTFPPMEYPELADDQTLIPSFAPPLRGRLTMTSFTRVGILKDMIALFGGIRFRHMDLFDVDGAWLLLGACAQTLETLRLYPSDPCKEPSLNGVRVLADNFIARVFIRDFDLSRIKSLRTLQVAARSIDGALWNHDGSPDAAASLLTYALSTITSPVFSEVAVFYRDYDFGFRDRDYWMPMMPSEKAEAASWHGARFEVLRKMHKARNFRLVLCADVWDRVGGGLGGNAERGRCNGKGERGV